MRSEFEAWVKSRGGYIHPGIDLFCQGPSGAGGGYRGVFATQAVAEGEQLLVIPVDTSLHLALPAPGGSGETVAATCSPALAAFLQQKKPQPAAGKKPKQHSKHKHDQQQQADEAMFSPFIATVLMLMAEVAQGRESVFAGYFATLPASTNCLVDWSDDDKKLLAGTSLQCEGRDVAAVFQEDILPRLQAPEAEGLFPPSCLTYDAFRRAVGLVQTRAFHMKADNWLTGASQECHDELYLIPGIDMLNHSTDPGRRNTSLALLRGEVSVALAGGGSKTFKDFFSMRAERDIPSGCEVLHTYGDLSDAQLLQTYGFIDLPPQPTPAAAGRGDSSGDGQQGQQAGQARLAGNPHNYVALRLSDVVEAARAVGLMVGLSTTGKKGGKLMDLKLKRLAAAGLLQDDNPAATRLLVSAESPLPDQLLTIVQVLMLSAKEFEQLQQEQPQGGSSAELSLGQELLCGEFGELCGSLLVQAVGTSLKRYPRDAAANAAVLQAADAGSCAWLAAAVALGEQQLLMRLKKAALQILVAAAEEDDDSDEDESDEEEDTDSDEPAPPPLKKGSKAAKAAGASSRQAAATAAAAAAAASASHKKRKQADSGKGAAAAKQPAECKKHKAAGKPGSADKAAHGKVHSRHGKKAKAKQQEKEQQQKQGKRAKYGSMTGPREEDVWQSDDSDKVGYSSPSEPESEPEAPAPADQQGTAAAAGAAAAAGGSRSKRRQQQQQQAADEPKRRARDGSHPRSRRGIGSGAGAAGGGGGEALHTYEVGASGHVREAHGHMLGPDEADLIASDDSDKVGYLDA